MKVAIDTHPLFTTRAGVARYLDGLLGGMAAACPEVSLEAIVWPYENFGYKQPLRAWRTFYRELLWARWPGPRMLAHSGADVWFSPALPLFGSGKLPHVATLHDLAVARHPERYRRWQRYRASARLRLLMEAERIICVSRFTADEAMSLLGIGSERLDVVYNGVTRLPEGRLPQDVPDDFYLFVGSLEPGKNLALLLKVWALAESEGRRLPPLCIAGERWPGVSREGVPPAGWRFLGAVDDGQLGALYRKARGLLFPSRYEGFGLPVVEAMALGCPVVCAPVASLPEVGGDAVCWAPHDERAWLAALRRMGDSNELRDELRNRGVVQAAKFTWEKTARETTEVWRRAAC